MVEATRTVRRVLVVEDDAALRSAVCRALRSGERVIEEASTCAEAFEALKHGCDLLLLDVRLPDGSGVRVAEAAAAASPSPLIVVVSGGPMGYLTIEVADDGPGFDPASLTREIGTFGTTKADGTGLGLYTAERRKGRDVMRGATP
ncbi:MAG TPA: response regulator [Polyangiaceae bacterium]|nr:response regulator [Polyangiaceae bacterium]